MKIYTRKGDKGFSFTLEGKKLKKSNIFFEFVGTIDELNSWLGFLGTMDLPDEIKGLLTEIQNHLFLLVLEATGRKQSLKEKVEFLERAIDDFEKSVEPLKNFILPGGSFEAGAIHIARCVARRAERVLVRYFESISKEPGFELAYLNRLSDLLFMMARYVNHKKGIKEIPAKL